MDAIKNVFNTKKKEASINAVAYLAILTTYQGNAVLVTFITAGYPTPQDTVPIMLAMQEGGADIIEMGVPFSDPVADGPAIQEANTVCLRFLFQELVQVDDLRFFRSL